MKKEKLIYLPLAILTIITTASGASLATPRTYAADPDASITGSAEVSDSCTLLNSDGISSTTHSVTLYNGTANQTVGTTTIYANCNDTSGYAVYALGYYDGAISTVLTGSNSQGTISTGSISSSSASHWAFKFATSGSSYLPTITTGYTEYSNIPSTNTKVVQYNATTAGNNSAFTVTYGASISSTQAAGTYSGGVKYTLVHPYTATKPTDA